MRTCWLRTCHTLRGWISFSLCFCAFFVVVDVGFLVVMGGVNCIVCLQRACFFRVLIHLNKW